MKVKSILIEFEPDKGDILNHAKSAKFENGTWLADGPMYSRLHPMLHEVWKIIRAAVTQEG